MKFIYLFILGLVIVESKNLFSFQMNAKEIQDITLKFKTTQLVDQLGLRCDDQSFDAWKSYNYQDLEVTSEQRKQYKCSDTNFTFSISKDFSLDEITLLVYDAGYYKEIAIFNFITNNTNIAQTALALNKSYLTGLPYVDNDFKISNQGDKFIFMEIIKCRKSYSTLSVKSYDQNLQYHNVPKMTYKNIFYDVVTTKKGDQYYRLTQNSYSPPDVFIKYQSASEIDINTIKIYGDKFYYLNGYESRGNIYLEVPTIQVFNYEKVNFQIVISNEDYESTYFYCIQGDQSLYNSYGNTAQSKLITVQQNASSGSQNVVVEFPSQDPGWYNVRVTAIVNHGQIKQSIPFETLQFYQGFIIFPDSLLVHILTPIIIGCIALIGLIVGACKYSAKKKKLQQQELLQYHQYNLSRNLQVQQTNPQYQ